MRSFLAVGVIALLGSLAIFIQHLHFSTTFKDLDDILNTACLIDRQSEVSVIDRELTTRHGWYSEKGKLEISESVAENAWSKYSQHAYFERYKEDIWTYDYPRGPDGYCEYEFGSDAIILTYLYSG